MCIDPKTGMNLRIINYLNDNVIKILTFHFYVKNSVSKYYSRIYKKDFAQLMTIVSSVAL